MWHHIFKLGGNGGSLWGRTLMCIMASASKAVRKASELVTASGLEHIRSLWKQTEQEMLLVPDDQGHWLCYLQSPSGETMGHVCAPNSGTLSGLCVWLGDCILQMPLLHSHRLWRCAAQPCASLSLSWELYWFYNNPQVGLHSLVVLLRVRWSSGAGGAMCSLSLPSPGHESHSSGFPALCSLHPLPRLGFSNVWLWSAFWSWTALRKKKKELLIHVFWTSTMLIFLQSQSFFFCVLSQCICFSCLRCSSVCYQVQVMRGLLLLTLVIDGVSWESWGAGLGLNLQVSCTANKWVVTKSQVLTAWWKRMQVLSILMTFLVPSLIQRDFYSVTSWIWGQNHSRMVLLKKHLFAFISE